MLLAWEGDEGSVRVLFYGRAPRAVQDFDAVAVPKLGVGRTLFLWPPDGDCISRKL